MHGLAVDGDMLWCVNSDDRAIFKLDSADGAPVAKIQLAREDPEPHGLDIEQHWYSLVLRCRQRVDLPAGVGRQSALAHLRSA